MREGWGGRGGDGGRDGAWAGGSSLHPLPKGVVSTLQSWGSRWPPKIIILHWCELQELHLHQADKDMLLAPHCQCIGKLWLWERSPGRGSNPPQTATVRMRGIRRVVPPWVAAAGHRLEASHAPDALETQVPRCTWRQLNVAPPVGYRAVVKDGNGEIMAMLRRHDCQVSPHALAVMRAADKALVEAQAFLRTLRFEMQEVLGSVGMNETMQQLLRDTATCWDWSRLVFFPPTEEQRQAFRHVTENLQPLLSKTFWPTAAHFGAVQHRWPDSPQLLVEYERLCARVRRAAGTRNRRAGMSPPSGGSAEEDVPADVQKSARGWCSLLTRVEVCPVGISGQAPATLTLSCKEVVPVARRRGTTSRRDLAVGDVVRLSPASQADWCLRQGMRISEAEAQPQPRFKVGRLHYRVDVSKVSAAIDMHPWFALGSAAGADKDGLAWCAARVAHKSRLLFPPESPCERMGNIMNYLFEPRQNPSPGHLEDLTLLRQAHVACVGGARDEMLVNVVVQQLQQTSIYRMDPCFNQRHHLRPAQQPWIVHELDEVLQKSGRTCVALPPEELFLSPGSLQQVSSAADRAEAIRQRRLDAQVVNLPAEMLKSKHMQRHGRMKRLPRDLLQLHAEQKNLPQKDSILRLAREAQEAARVTQRESQAAHEARAAKKTPQAASAKPKPKAPAKEGLSASGPGLGSAGKSASGSGSAKCPQFQKAAGDMNDDTPLLMLHLAGSAKGHAKAASKGSPSKAASAASVPGSKRKRTGGDC